MNEYVIKNGLIVDGNISSSNAIIASSITASLAGTSSNSNTASYLTNQDNFIDLGQPNFINITDAVGDSIQLNSGNLTLTDGTGDNISMGTGFGGIQIMTQGGNITLTDSDGENLTIGNTGITLVNSFGSGITMNNDGTGVVVTGILSASGSLFGTSSYTTNAVSSSHSVITDSAISASNSITSSFATKTISASFSNVSISASYAASSSINLPIAITIGGTGTTSSVEAAKNVGIYLASVPAGGNSAVGDIMVKSPSYPGQLGVSYFNGKSMNYYPAGSTGQGDWFHVVNFPAGMNSIGDPDFADPTNNGNYTTFNFNGNPSLWQAQGDTILVSTNWSANSGSSGTQLGLSVMTTGSGITATSFFNTGSGYSVGDVLTLGAGSNTGSVPMGVTANIRVTGITSGGHIASTIMTNYGQYFTTPTSPVSASGGTGTGAVFNIVTASRAINLANNGCTWAHAPINRLKALIPGWSYMVFNADAKNLKGYSICAPGISGIDSGNYSLGMFDFINKSFRIPKWITASFQPSDAGWADTFIANPVNGTVLIPSGSLTAPNITGSLFGSSSYALTASYALVAGGGSGTTLVTASTYQITSSNAISSSYSLNADTASYLIPGSVFFTSTGSIYFADNNHATQTQTYITNSAANILNINCGGALSLQITANGGTLRNNGNTNLDWGNRQLNNGNWTVANGLSLGTNLTAVSISSSAVTASLWNGVTINPLIQAGSQSLVAATSAMFLFKYSMPNISYALSLSSNATITSLIWSGKTVTGFTSSMGVFTGIIDYIASSYS